MANKKPIVYRCHVCNVELISERVEALLEMGVTPDKFTCLKHSQVKKYQAIYNSDLNNSGIKIVKKVENDSVRHKFYKDYITTEEKEDEILSELCWPENEPETLTKDKLADDDI